MDPSWEGESKLQPNVSHLRRFPSKWRSIASQQDPLSSVKIVDHFVIEQTLKPTSQFRPAYANGSAAH